MAGHESPRESTFRSDAGPTPANAPHHGVTAAPGHQWAIVLAGGAGKRISQWTIDGLGNEVPKQYRSLAGGRSLLGDTLARAARLVPTERIVTVVRGDHERFWRREFEAHGEQSVVVQPRDRGTAAGVLLPLLRIMARDRKAIVTLMPSDHFVADDAALVNTLRSAQEAVTAAPDRVLLLGIPPSEPDPEYGWIVPGGERDGALSVRRFVEKPSPREADELMRAGALWNSFLLVGRGWTILDLFDRQLPGYVDTFLNMRVNAEPGRVGDLYERLASADFCRDVLQGCEEHLGLHVAPECGWTDLGTPTRLAACVDGLRQRGTPCGADSLGAALAARPAPSALSRSVPRVGQSRHA